MIFDIRMKGISDGQVTFLEPLLAPLSIESFTLCEGIHRCMRGLIETFVDVIAYSL